MIVISIYLSLVQSIKVEKYKKHTGNTTISKDKKNEHSQVTVKAHECLHHFH